MTRSYVKNWVLIKRVTAAPGELGAEMTQEDK